MPRSINAAALLAWYDAHRRDVPWRRTRDPYAIWVSEAMLQQTQVSTALPYYERWMSRFPTLESLAAASEQDALSLWQGLGYYRRCRMLLEGARRVVAAGLPNSASEWLLVPGIGRYTAAAIASICNAEAVAVMDGNVRRVFARMTASRATGSKLDREAWKWAESLVPADRPGDWNQAMMELGAIVCRPKAPRCDSCPLASACEALKQNLQADLPVRASPPEIVPVQSEAWIHRHGTKFAMEQVSEGEWWHGMWRFPGRPYEPGVESRHLGTIRHTITRHRVSMDVYYAEMERDCAELRWFSGEELSKIALPSPHRKALDLALAASRSPASQTASR